VKVVLVTATVLAFAATAAQADIICMPTGSCWETGLKIWRNGGAYPWARMQAVRQKRRLARGQVERRNPWAARMREVPEGSGAASLVIAKLG
jgi:hypothetical protein